MNNLDLFETIWMTLEFLTFCIWIVSGVTWPFLTAVWGGLLLKRIIFKRW